MGNQTVVAFQGDGDRMREVSIEVCVCVCVSCSVMSDFVRPNGL